MIVMEAPCDYLYFALIVFIFSIQNLHLYFVVNLVVDMIMVYMQS